ncbi:hypothetical protein [Shuttleworthella satelles]|uniref:Uncharacterized protein n=1 Tax=Shuttleworthella satelles DSM 14600 TaxID=626523 RepID=C4GBL5_9FIRM|nr:hypothetical protein [Shuttleworthia satelles]EEP28508.1 hypothetical protein GCWU000342_01318 [Shuttleworthia satelles DSM 14600]
MSDFSELRESLRGRGAGMNEYGNINGESVYLSRGIRQIFLGESCEQSLIQAVRCFENRDFGDAALHQKKQKEGHEYGRYDIAPLGREKGEDSGVYMHKADDAILVYFAFER